MPKYARVLIYWVREYISPSKATTQYYISLFDWRLSRALTRIHKNQPSTLTPQTLIIDNFSWRYTKFFPFFLIKIHFKIWGFPSSLQGCWGQRRPEKMKVPKFQIWHYFCKKITALINKNVIELFVRCTVYELWFSFVCRFCMDPPFYGSNFLLWCMSI